MDIHINPEDVVKFLKSMDPKLGKTILLCLSVDIAIFIMVYEI